MTTAEIKSIRRSLHLNTRDFGALVGVSGRTVEDWEQGRRTPSASATILIKQVAKAAAAGNRPHEIV